MGPLGWLATFAITIVSGIDKIMPKIIKLDSIVNLILGAMGMLTIINGMDALENYLLAEMTNFIYRQIAESFNNTGAEYAGYIGQFIVACGVFDGIKIVIAGYATAILLSNMKAAKRSKK
jgi:hypothetical protein